MLWDKVDGPGLIMYFQEYIKKEATSSCYICTSLEVSPPEDNTVGVACSASVTV